MTSAGPVRILTLNTWKNEGAYAARIRAITSGLRALAPDVILLQEVFRTTGGEAHTSVAFADALGMVHAYAPGRAKPRSWQGREVPSESGLAILARGPITRVERLPLPSDDAGGERLALLVNTRIRGRMILAGCVHLSHLRGDDARRAQQLAAVLANPRWSEPAAIRVLGGDFNATADSAAVTGLAAHPDLRIADVRADGPVAPATYPLPPREGQPGRTIDYLLAISPRAEMAPRIQAAGVALAEPIDGTWPSDHAAVWADLDPQESR
jgi:endonuclease/exonuclease/phosphatase family metal-dependent hydrolase